MIWWEAVLISVFGYLVVGLGVGSLCANLTYRESGNKEEAVTYGMISLFCWPLAVVVFIIGFIWLLIFKPILTPKKIKDQQKAEYQERVAKAVAAGKDPKSVPKRFVPEYED